MRKLQRHRRSLTWIASLSAAAVVATVGATAVLAEGPACTTADGQVITQEEAAADPTLCPEPGPEPEPDPAPTDPAPADPAPTDPAPTDPTATDPAPADPAPPTPADPTRTTATQPTATEPAPTTPAPTRPTKQTPRPVAPKPAADPVEEQATQVLKAKRFQAAPFRDARTFREQFEPAGRIPAQPKMSEADAQLLADAAKGTSTSWATMTAVAWLESRWDDPSAGGIVGRRLTPAAWRAYGTDGDGDGRVTRSSRADQAKTVATFLAESRSRDRAALEAYFSGTKRDVMAERALFLADYFDALGQEALVNGLDDPATRAALEDRTLSDDTIEIYDGGRSDIEAGLIDPRVLVTMRFLANRYESVTISSLVSGHGVYTSSGNVSLHSYGQAMDIAALGGESILGNQQRGGKTWHAVQDVLLLAEAMQPVELISLWEMGGPSFAASDHHDHIHVGWKTQEGPALASYGSFDPAD